MNIAGAANVSVWPHCYACPEQDELQQHAASTNYDSDQLDASGGPDAVIGETSIAANQQFWLN